MSYYRRINDVNKEGKSQLCQTSAQRWLQKKSVKFVTRKKVVERMGDLLGERWYLSIERVENTTQNTNQGNQSDWNPLFTLGSPKRGGGRNIFIEGKKAH